jgi:hypothetical protein
MSALRKGSAVREIGVVSLTEIAFTRTRGKLTFTKGDAMAGVAARCPSLETPDPTYLR